MGFQTGGRTIDALTEIENLEEAIALNYGNTITVSVADEAAMLALEAHSGAYRVIRLDDNRLYYLDGGKDTSVIGNWVQGPYTKLPVSTFNGRDADVAPKKGDYKSSMIKVTHDDDGTNGFFGIDNTGIYWDDGYDALDDNGDA